MNKTLMMIIALGVIVIAGTLVYQATKQSPAEEVADSVSDAANEIGDEIGDAATGN